MRPFLLCILFSYSLSAIAQNNSRVSGKNLLTPINDHWNLDKFVWSRTHPGPGRHSKPLLDFGAIDNWISLVDDHRDLSISPNGEYFAYGIANFMNRRMDSLVVQSISHTWRESFAGAIPGFFSVNSLHYIFWDKDKGLCFLQTGSGQRQYIQTAISYKIPGNGKNEWIAYQVKNAENTVVLQNLFNTKEQEFKNISAYDFDKSNQWLIMQSSDTSKELLLYNLQTHKVHQFSSVTSYSLASDGNAIILKTSRELQYVNLKSDTTPMILYSSQSTSEIESYALDGSGTKVAWVVSDPIQQNDSSNFLRTLWYWREGMTKAVERVNNQLVGWGSGVFIQGPISFTPDGTCIQFSLQELPDSRQPSPDAAQVNVWSYQDTVLQSTQLHLVKDPVIYQALINAETGQLIWRDNKFEQLKPWFNLKNYALIGTINNAPLRSLKHGDRFWEKDYWKDSIWLISLQDGRRRFFTSRIIFNEIWASPDSLYLLYFDRMQGHYFSYNIYTGQRKDISIGIPAGQLGIHHTGARFLANQGREVGRIYWLAGKTSLLVYDDYDIWQLDYTGKKAPVNVTNGYGRLHKIIFRWNDGNVNKSGTSFFLGDDTLLLNAFNTQTKWNGYYHKSLKSGGNPEILFMGPYFMDLLPGTYGLNGGMPPLKARMSRTWIIQRESANEAPNYFITNNFKSFTALTDLQPHKRYNWLTAELHKFKRLDGTMSQGVLYKPENFDPQKKYPVIVSFYLSFSDRCYQYPQAQYIIAPNLVWGLAWMVSQDYLVFMPDVSFTKDKWGPSTVNTMDGAARYLRSLPFVDGKHLGACGHSNSGRFGYYLLTHSHSFAAMSIGAGFGGPDILSGALSLSMDGVEESMLKWAESESAGAGLGPIWQHKQSWIDHTAVLQADKVTSPLLLTFHNGDPNPVRYGTELFIALRRLEKKVWWLQYDNGGHTVAGAGNDPKDLSLRFTQFFDHYLKGAPAPRWMTQGIPARLKGVEARYDLDTNGKCNSNCKICAEWNKRVKKESSQLQKTFGK